MVAISTEGDNCTTGAVRLIGSETDATREGRVEVCINNAWGTICDDSAFDSVDAGVVCQNAGGFFQTGKYVLDLLAAFIPTIILCI